eukprot:TRINITY_DN5898_c0_g1_i1.p1 TRINITY_DN5898_c0_g1~~TRINITY_DN5898_c0_g1_i1.p1  ORF type:complete len:463 (+),score=100.45 TRINITY_DN5898_c0_g1_i1:3-1391(+)
MKVWYSLVVVSLVFTSVLAEVLVVTTDNFDEVVASSPALVVEFYAPWCGHCKNLEPEYEAASEILKNDDPAIILAKVDATEERDLAERFDVQGYPTLKIFKAGLELDYNGPRETDGIVSYLRKKFAPAVTEIATIEGLDRFKGSGSVVISFESEISEDFRNAADLIEDLVFGAVTESSVASSAGYENGIVLFREQDGAEVVFDGSLDLTTWLQQRSLPVAGEMTPENAHKYGDADLPQLTIYFDVDWEKNVKRTNYYKRRAAKVGAEFEGQVLFAIAKIDMVGDVSNYGVESEEALGEHLVTITSPGGAVYLFSDVFDKFSVSNLRDFTQQFLDGKLTRFLKSEPLPVNNDGPVTIVVGENFDEIVADESKNVLIEFYAPWCGHCKTLAPKYEALGDAFADRDDVVIAKIDATANAWDTETYNVRGFPTLYFKPAGASPTILSYEGPREVKDMEKWIKKNAT